MEEERALNALEEARAAAFSDTRSEHLAEAQVYATLALTRVLGDIHALLRAVSGR